MTIWVCGECGHEFEVEGDEIPVACPECGGVTLSKRPNQNGGLKPIRP